MQQLQRHPKNDSLIHVLLYAITMVFAFATTAFAQTPVPENQGLNLWPESHIDCADDRWEITVEDPKGQPVTVIFSRDRIILCGWVMDGWEMFVVNKRGCMVKRDDRWWMRGVDAERVRQCFR